MRILYCRVGWMTSYKGSQLEKPIGGGKYNKDNIGYECYNYLGCNNMYYGFVEVGVNKTIHIDKISKDNKDYVDNVLVIWVAKKREGGQCIVGWYNNAKVYRELQKVPDDVMESRKLKSHSVYNIFSDQVYLIEPQERNFQINGMGHSNIWYGNTKTNQEVYSYIKHCSDLYDERVKGINSSILDIYGKEKDAIVKVRINQDEFRKSLINKYNCKCCLCGVNNPDLLIASHIKPWAQSDKYEKLSPENGLLLCPNHDKLFDSGYISFDDNGGILISEKLDMNTKIFMNINGNMKIEVNDDNLEFVRYHRMFVFNKL